MPGKHKAGQNYRLNQVGHKVRGMKAKHQPNDGPVSVLIPLDVHRRKLEGTQDEGRYPQERHSDEAKPNLS
jgi:hypothetical protein